MRVFLDIDIGDAAVYAEQVTAFTLTSAFYERAGPQVAGRTPLLTVEYQMTALERLRFFWCSLGCQDLL